MSLDKGDEGFLDSFTGAKTQERKRGEVQSEERTASVVWTSEDTGHVWEEQIGGSQARQGFTRGQTEGKKAALHAAAERNDPMF